MHVKIETDVRIPSDMLIGKSKEEANIKICEAIRNGQIAVLGHGTLRPSIYLTWSCQEEEDWERVNCERFYLEDGVPMDRSTSKPVPDTVLINLLNDAYKRGFGE